MKKVIKFNQCRSNRSIRPKWLMLWFKFIQFIPSVIINKCNKRTLTSLELCHFLINYITLIRNKSVQVVLTV